MFFILSKLLSFLFAPYFWIFLLFILTFFIKTSRLRCKLRVLAIVLFYLFSNTFICNQIIKIWEVPPTPYNELKPEYDYGIVLCGMATYNTDFQRINFLSSIDRLLQAVDLYKKDRVKKLFLVGGSGSMVDTSREAFFLRDYLVNLGIPSGDIIVEPDSRNTYENAQMAMKLVTEKKLNGDFLLITSAFHMRRSIGCFKKAGFRFDHFSTNSMSGSNKITVEDIIVPNPYAMAGWSLLFHEMFGYLIYSWTGFI